MSKLSINIVTMVIFSVLNNTYKNNNDIKNQKYNGNFYIFQISNLKREVKARLPEMKQLCIYYKLSKKKVNLFL